MQDVLKIVRTKEELKNILVKSIFSWIGAYNISHFSNFSDFVDFCSSFSIFKKISLYTCVLGLHLHLSMK